MDMITVSATCPFCGRTTEVEVPFDGFVDWNEGVSIQDAMPRISAEVREVLISGICPKCQAKIFSSDDYEEEDVDECERESLEFTGQWW